MRVFLEDAYVVLNNAEEVYPAKLFIRGEKLKKGYAYIRKDVVYIYHGKLKKTADSSKPGIYKTDDGYMFVEPSESEIERIYSVDNLVTLDTSDIIRKVAKNKENYQQPEDLEIINNNSELYVPTIKDDDDFLKKLVKRAIINKKINISNYRSRFKDDYSLNNMKSGLKRETKMTVTNFRSWCEILGLDFEVSIRDNGTDTVNPLPEDLTVTNED